MMRYLFLSIAGFLFYLPGSAQQKAANCILNVQEQVSPTSCAGGMDGRVELQLSGGKAPYRVQWSDGGEGQQRQDLASATYRVRISDAHHCQLVKEIEVPGGAPLTGELQISQQKEAGGQFSLQVALADGSRPYAINIKNMSKGPRAPSQNYTGQRLPAGRYLLEAFNSAGCSQMKLLNLGAQ